MENIIKTFEAFYQNAKKFDDVVEGDVIYYRGSKHNVTSKEDAVIYMTLDSEPEGRAVLVNRRMFEEGCRVV